MNDSTFEQDHAWFAEQIATALADGLSADERARFEAHAAACASCRAMLEAHRADDVKWAALFESAQPAPGLEDRVIQTIRVSRGRGMRGMRGMRIAPAVVRAAGGIAAVIAVAATGYAVTNAIGEGGVTAMSSRVRVASNLRQIGQALSLSSNESQGPAPQAAHQAMSQPMATPQEMAERFQRHLAYAYQNVPGDRSTDARRFVSNESLKKDFEPGAGADSADKSRRPEDIVDRALVRDSGSAGESSRLADEMDGKSVVKALPSLSAAGSSAPAINGRFSGTADHGLVAGKASGDAVTYYGMNAPAAGAPQSGGSIYFMPRQFVQAGDAAGREQQNQLRTEVANAAKPAASAPPAKAPANFNAGVLLPVDATADAPAAAALTVATTQPGVSRKIIHSVNMEFEVDRFDAAFAQVVNLTREAGGYVGSTDSDKLPKGKVKGTIVLRVPPQRLDTLILQLRGIGDLRSQKLNAEDITKQYSDLDSQLRAARAMEERLLDLIKNGKGQIKELLAAEKELGEWRTKIEKIVGEQRYYDNLVGMATLNLTLYEKDIRTPATAYEAETIDAGVETEDVEKSRAEALKAIEAAKGRVVQSDLKRYDAGQFAATIVAEVSPDAAGPLLDRLKQLGKMARLDVQRKQTTDSSASSSSASPAPAPVRVEKRDTKINLSLYNLANVAPRQTVAMSLAAEDIEAAYRNIIERVTKAGGRIVTSNLNRNKPEQTSGLVSFEVPSAQADAVASDVRAMGEVMTTAVSENPDTSNVTTAKRLYNVQLYAAAGVRPRETTRMSIASANVSAARQALLDAASGAGGRVLASQLNDSDRQNVTAGVDLEIRRDALPALEKALAAAGDAISRSVERAATSENTIDTKVRYQVSLSSAEHLPPRETTTLAVELSNVETAMGDIQTAAQEAGGRTVDSNLSKQRDGRTVGKIVVDVPLDKSQEIVSKARGEGAVRVVESSKNAQVPAGKLARARVDITFGTADTLVEPGRGLWATIRNGLSTSVTGLLWSLQIIVVGLCFVLPWALVIGVLWKLWKRGRTPGPAAAATS